MTTDLWMLVGVGVLAMFVFLIYGVGRFRVPGGIAWAFGNRDSPFDVPPWVSRAVRAHRNLTENIGPFAILVLTAHVAGKANDETALGAILFFCARVAHVPLYTFGVAYMRTAAFAVGMLGEVIILIQLFR